MCFYQRKKRQKFNVLNKFITDEKRFFITNKCEDKKLHNKITYYYFLLLFLSEIKLN